MNAPPSAVVDGDEYVRRPLIDALAVREQLAIFDWDVPLEEYHALAELRIQWAKRQNLNY